MNAPEDLPDLPLPDPSASAVELHAWAHAVPLYNRHKYVGLEKNLLMQLIPPKPGIATPFWWALEVCQVRFQEAVCSGVYQPIHHTWEAQLQANLQGHQTPCPVRLYRGLYRSPYIEKMFQDLSRLKVGDTWVSEAYMATSCNAIDALWFCSVHSSHDAEVYVLHEEAIFMAVDLPAGHPVVPVHGNNEEEIILNKKTTFRVKATCSGQQSQQRGPRVLMLEPLV